MSASADRTPSAIEWESARRHLKRLAPGDEADEIIESLVERLSELLRRRDEAASELEAAAKAMLAALAKAESSLARRDSLIATAALAAGLSPRVEAGDAEARVLTTAIVDAVPITAQ